MVLIKQGVNPNAGMVTTSMGLRAPRPPLCWTCRERREGEIYTLDANGQPICDTCEQKRLNRNAPVVIPDAAEVG